MANGGAGVTVALAYLPTWEGTGLCVDRPSAMYAETESQIQRARALCRACPVLAQCRTWVQALPWRADPGGVVAGMTPEERGHPDLAVPGKKRCTKCKQELPFSEFSPMGTRLKSHCKACMRRADVERRRAAKVDALPGEPHKHCPRCKTTRGVSRFYPNRKNRDGLAVWCKPCFDQLRGTQ
jgi:hypothetical protein